MTESKYLKREFGEPLPTFNGVMKKHKINKLKEDWWDDLGPEGQAKYLKDNPGSQKAQDAKKDDSDDETQSQVDKGDAKDFFKNASDSSWFVPSESETQELTKDMDDKQLGGLISSQQASVDHAQEQWDQEMAMTQGYNPMGGPTWEDSLKMEKQKLAALEGEKERRNSRAADDEADDMKWDDAQDSRDAEDRKDAGVKPIKKDKDTKRMGDSIQRKIGGSRDPDRLEVQGTQEASNGQTIIQYKDKEDGSMVGVDAQGNIYEDGEKQNYGVDVSTQSDVFGDDQNAQLSYKQQRARETGGTDPYTGKQYRTGKELTRKEAKHYVRRNKMKITEDILRKVIRNEIRNMMKEDEESFSQPIPAQIDRYMKKFIDAVGRGNLNRKRKLAILGRTIVALRLDPSEVSKYARLVKREL